MPPTTAKTGLGVNTLSGLLGFVAFHVRDDEHQQADEAHHRPCEKEEEERHD